MSAAAGISSAKKRRGVAPEPTQNVKNQQQPSQQQQPQQYGNMITPIQILQNHEVRLKSIEKKLLEDDTASAVKQSSVPATATTTISATSNPADARLLFEYKSKCDALEKRVEELSQLIHKVQTFSMESNLAFLKLKRVFDEDFEHRIQELKHTFTPEDFQQNIKLNINPVEALSTMSASS